jgi:hypothetical protein
MPLFLLIDGLVQPVQESRSTPSTGKLFDPLEHPSREPVDFLLQSRAVEFENYFLKR